MTRLERYAQLYRVLRIVEDAYEKGDFTEFVSLLAEDCVYESMWVLQPLRGREAVSRHLLGKGEAIRKSESFPRAWIVELVGNINPLPKSDVVVNGKKQHASVGLAYEAGKFCLMLRQVLDDKTNEMLVDLKLTEDGKVQRIDLCIPDLFYTSDMQPSVIFFPANGDEENLDAQVYINSRYFSELYLFFAMADEYCDEYDDLEIPMEKWEQILSFWKDFIDASDYDAFFEKAAGVDYENWSGENKEVLNSLQHRGADIWEGRRTNARMLRDLQEWTQKYKDSYTHIYTYGY